MRLILGLIKGAIVGALVGLAAYGAGLTGGFHWITYGLAGALAGAIAGRPPWAHLSDKNSTIIVTVIKAVVGFGVGCGIYALVSKVWGGVNIHLLDGKRNLYDWQPLMAGIIGAIYGAWVELDDASPASGSGDKKTAPAKKAK